LVAFGETSSLHALTAFLASNFYAGQYPKPQHSFLHQGNLTELTHKMHKKL